MKKIAVLLLAVTALVACNKDKFKTQPQVEIKSFGPNVISNKETFTLRAIVRDKEGDLKDTITFYRKYFNGATMVKQDSFLKYNLANFGFPKHDEIEVQLLFSYGEDRSPTYLLQNTEIADRDLVIGIVVKDNAGNRSDYVETNRITLKKP
jgi:hypothetical protein